MILAGFREFFDFLRLSGCGRLFWFNSVRNPAVHLNAPESCSDEQTRYGRIDPQSPLSRRCLCDVEKSAWVSVGDEQ
jgi:hypothetical protein